jgi:1-acyl-sn-glycerol-3-phosphate acyltransferase
MNVKVQKIWYWLNQWGCRIGCTLFFGVRIHGRENIPRSGGVLLLSNHQSFLDPLLCGIGPDRQLYYVARDTLFKNPAFKWLIKSVNAIAIKRGTADIAAMKIIIGKLKEGRAVVLFPEATRTHDGRIADIKPGFGLISRRANVPVLPVLIDGAFECWPRTNRIFRPGRISIVYGELIGAEKIKSLGDEQFAIYLTQILRQMQNDLRAKANKETYSY